MSLCVTYLFLCKQKKGKHVRMDDEYNML